MRNRLTTCILSAIDGRTDMFSLHIDAARGWRGSQRQAMYTVLGLRTLGHRAALVAHPQSELFRRMSEGLDLIPLEIRREIDLEAAWRLSRVIRTLAPDVIHAHDVESAGVAATALSIGSGSTRPALVLSRRRESAMSRQSFSRWTFTQVDCFVATTAAIRDQLVAGGLPRHKTAVVNEGVDVERIVHMPAANVHAEFFLPTHSPIVGNVASLVPDKGQRYLIDAAARVVREVPDARFVILGDGELRHVLEEHIRHRHLERHVFLGGFRGDAIELTKGFDLVAVSSLHEGMCTTIVEAMAASKAVVATAVGSIPEVVVHGETGLLVRPREPDALAGGIVRLLRDAALRRRMGEAARARARERFTVERMVGATAALYERLAGMRRATDTGSRVALD